MKQGNTLTTFVMFLLAAGITCYFGVHVFNTFTDPFTTTFAYAFSINESVEVDALLVRNEVVLSSQSGIVQSWRSEGERVGAGQKVAVVYEDSQALENQILLESLTQEAEIITAAMSQNVDAISAALLDEEILQTLVTIRGDVASQNYTQLDSQVTQLKSTVLARAYTYGGTLSQAELSAQLASIQSQMSALSTPSSKTIYAPVAGTYSAQVDGYESLLTPDSVTTMSPGDLSALLSTSTTPDTASPGKLITGTQWYLSTALAAEDVSDLEVGSALQVSFSGSFHQMIDMTVSFIGEPVDGMCILLLVCDRYLESTTLLREQTVELIYQTATGLRIPKAALRMETSTTTDAETAVETTTQVLGVYTIIAGRAEFQAVTTLAEGSDFYIVSPVDTSARGLKAGDEIILRGTDLYDGKTISY